MQVLIRKKWSFIDLFSGIGGMRIAFERLGGKCVFSSEWNLNAVKTYAAYFSECPSGDITQIRSSSIPFHDILVAGFPCQSFSLIGNMRGFKDTRGTLFFEIERILRSRQPKAFLLENVKNLASHNKGQTLKVILWHLKQLGYHVQWKILNALDYNLPQKRERIVIVGFKKDCDFQWPKSQSLIKKLELILEPEGKVDSEHFVAEKIKDSILRRLKGKSLPRSPWISHENKSGNVSPLPYSCALRANPSHNYLLVNGVRRLTSRELLRLQGFPDDFPIVCNKSEVRKQCGNSVPISMIEAVARQIVKTI